MIKELSHNTSLRDLTIIVPNGLNVRSSLLLVSTSLRDMGSISGQGLDISKQSPASLGIVERGGIAVPKDVRL